MALFMAQVAPLITITIPWSYGALRFINYLLHCKSLLKKYHYVSFIDVPFTYIIDWPIN